MSSIKECTLAFFKGLAFGKGLIKGRELNENKDLAEDRWITIHPWGMSQSEGDTGEGKGYYRRIFIDDETGEIEKGLGAGTNIKDLSKTLKAKRKGEESEKTSKTDNETTSKQPKTTEPKKTEQTGNVIESPQGEITEVKKTDLKDFGEYLVGAKKDLYKDLSAELTSTDLLKNPLSKTWPIDGINNIEDPNIAAAVMALRMNVPKKPNANGWSAEFKRKAWVKDVNKLRDEAAEIVKTGDVSGLTGNTRRMQMLLSELPRSQWGGVSNISGGNGFMNPMYIATEMVKGNLVDLRSEDVKANATSNYAKGDFYKSYFDMYEVETSRGKFIALADSGKNEKESIKALADIIQKASPETEKAKEDLKKKGYTFNIYEDLKTGKYFIAKKGDRNYTKLKEFDDVKDARLFNTSEHHVELTETFNAIKAAHDVDESKLRFRSNERHGGDYRGGKASTPESYDKAFGFRGVQFGNWVAQTGELSRQNLMDQAYDALKDLANTAGITSKDISLDGTLGLAFGARGSGGKNAALAHYEPGTKVINLTKYGGAGCVAHEWFHALDNYVATKNGNGRGEFSTVSPYYLRENEKLFKASDDLRKALSDTDFYKASVKADKYRSKDYWSTTHELAARGFEAYVRDKMAEKGESNKFLVNYGESDVWPSKADIKKLAPIYDNYLKAVRETNWNKLRESEE